MKVSAIKCTICDSVVWSQSRHDFRYCDCKKCFIDGGRSYTRMGWEPGVKPILGVLDTETGTFSSDDEEDLFQ